MNRRLKSISAVIVLSLIPLFLSGQKPDDTVTVKGDIFFDIESISFFKNNEYFNQLTEGYTLPGAFIRPAIAWSPSPVFEIRLGLHQQIYSGQSKAGKPEILFSSAWKITPSTVLSIGSLKGCDSHRLFDPLFDAERVYSNFNETGISLVTEKGSLFSDTWVNWENFISKGDTVREVFTAGESLNYAFPLAAEVLKISLPLQVKFKHYGGQISNYESHVLTYCDIAAGAKFILTPAGERFGSISAEYLWFGSKELTGKGDAGVISGNASWIRLHYNYRFVYLGSFLWIAKNFYSPDGNTIYSSVSDYRAGLIIPQRRIWTTAAYITLKPRGIFEFLAGFEGYYDIREKRMDNAVVLHLRFNNRINLRKR